MKSFKFPKHQLYKEYDPKNQPMTDQYNELSAAAAEGKDIWFKVNSGSRTGSIGKLLAPEEVFPKLDARYYYMIEIGGDRNPKVTVDFGSKQIEMGLKILTDLEFLLDYEGDYVTKFTKGIAAAKPTEVKNPDLLGNNIKVGDWVIYQSKTRYAANTVGLGKLNRISNAGNAWVMSVGKNGEEREVQTLGCNALIKIQMTDELLATYVLCGTLFGLKTKLTIDLDVDEDGNIQEA